MNFSVFNLTLAFANDATFECCILPIIIIVIIIVVSIWGAIQHSIDEKKRLEFQKEEQAKRDKEEAERTAKYQKEYKEKMEKLKQLLAQSQEDYFDSLEKLKSDSTNADLKQNTLQLGRKYSEITRKFEGDGKVTIYDEIALMNDINAACAGSNPISSQTVEERLTKLSELKDKNLISVDEHEARRQRILDEI